MWRGLAAFYVICSIGAVANVGVGTLLYARGEIWWLAGLASAIVGAAWNYGASRFFTWGGAVLSMIFGDEVGRPNFAGLWRAFLQLPGAVGSRWRARTLAQISDSEALRRPLGGYFRDRFQAAAPVPERLSVLFVSPYFIIPPAHGGGVFMYQTLRELAKLDQQQSQVVDLRYFGGLSIEETAHTLGISTATVKREWATARIWLHRTMSASALHES